MSIAVIPTKVITGPGTQFSYCYPFEPKSINGGTPKYSCQLKIPKSDTKTVGAIHAAMEAAYAEGESKLKGSGKSVPPLSALKTPLRDGDIERADDPDYAGYWFLNANSTTPPHVVDAQCQAIFDPSEVYSGCFGKASITFYAFNNNGNRGIACGLNGLQKIKDGPRLGGRASAEEDFGVFTEDGEDDEDFLA